MIWVKFISGWLLGKLIIMVLSHSFSYNGLKQYKDAIEILKPMLNIKDPLIRVEYNKAVEALKKEAVVSDSQKDTYAKMFNPEKRKEEKQKREQDKKSDEPSNKSDSGKGIMNYVIPALFAVGIIGAVVYKTIKK